MPTYYDLVLGIIPLAFIGGIAAGSVAQIALPTAAGAASLLTIGIVGHALFINPPVNPEPLSTPDHSTTTPSHSTDDAANGPAEFAD